ncbi:UNVERIFIED_CONTAM: hypothetical protein Sradi_7238600 [Sesamum radiatum]|uniref:Reverse transcriptase domain-containing protein n=1 Tax=Sesamum radiatum TaxID=300843 RepID=A0AAW2IMG6_SESRA
MFRFDNYLTMSSDFTPSVQNIWRHRIEGTAMYAVTRKLRALKPVFRSLRKERATKLEQNMLQQRAKIQWLKGGDQCSRIFFRKWPCDERLKRVFQITNEAGRILTEHDEVVDEFVSFFQRLLGGERRREFLDLRYLRPWARHVVTPDESMELVQSVTREEIKDAFFDIAEDKAPGPDGYSSGFYKAAWPVIGEEVVKAILEFFTTGRLLKQINTTILALIPKRLRSVLDKMISPSQNAFVPGRSIGDNILLAQEMFSGYNRQGLPMRCALKLMMQQLIDQNEGFSFHWRCKEIGLFQLCFADDLLLFCKADVASVRIFRHGLDEFAKLSGLHANPQKSQLILSRSAQPMREHLLAALQFQEGHLPLRETSIDQVSAYVAKCLLGDGLHITERGHQQLRKGCVTSCGKEIRQWDIQRVALGVGENFFAYDQHFFPTLKFKVGNGELFSIWHDPWHSLGTLIRRFPSGPSRTNIPIAAKLSTVIVDGDWRWPPITDMECIEILHLLPTIHSGSDSILWRGVN